MTTPESSRLIAETLRLDGEATNGPWNVWDGPVYVGGGKDICIGQGETWLTNMNEREHGDQNITIACDFGPQSRDEMTEDDEREITREQEANAALIVHNRTSAPRLARMLQVAIKTMTAITAHPDCDVALAEIEKIARGES